MNLQPAHPDPIDVLRADVMRDVMGQLVPQRREIGADLDAPVGVAAMYPRIATDVEVLACVLAAAVVADDDLRVGCVPGIVAALGVALHDGAPIGIVGGGPGRGAGCGRRCAANQSRECQCNDSSHVNNDSHLAI